MTNLIYRVNAFFPWKLSMKRWTSRFLSCNDRRAIRKKKSDTSCRFSTKLLNDYIYHSLKDHTQFSAWLSDSICVESIMVKKESTFGVCGNLCTHWRAVSLSIIRDSIDRAYLRENQLFNVYFTIQLECKPFFLNANFDHMRWQKYSPLASANWWQRTQPRIGIYFTSWGNFEMKNHYISPTNTKSKLYLIFLSTARTLLYFSFTFLFLQ